MALKIQVITAPTRTGDCGAAESRVKWILEPGDTGWVIQRMTRNHDVLKCDDTQDAALSGAKGCLGETVPIFWEAWRVENGRVFIGRTQSEHQSDTFSSLLDHPNRKRIHALTGKVQFVAGYTLTIGTGADDWQENDIPRAGALPTRRTQPTGWSVDSARNHNLSVEWNCCVMPLGEPTVTGDPTTSDEGIREGESMKSIIPFDASSSAKRVARLLFSMPPWLNLGFNTKAEVKLLEGLRRVSAFHTDVIRGGIEFFIDQSKRKKSYSLDEQSKLYLLNRYLFRLPRLMLRGQLPFFGGWVIPYESKRFNPSWPFVPQPGGRLVLKGAFRGYMGDEFLALAEFDYFRKYYPRQVAIRK